MLITAIDPGTTESAYVNLKEGRIDKFGRVPNGELLKSLSTWAKYGTNGPRPATAPHLVIEMVASYGMPVGAEVFETCVWIGRFVQAWADWMCPHEFVYRRDVRNHLCNRRRDATDATVRQALIDRYGPGKSVAIGVKAKPGPLYGIKADVWQALAVAVTYADLAAQSSAGKVGR